MGGAMRAIAKANGMDLTNPPKKGGQGGPGKDSVGHTAEVHNAPRGEAMAGPVREGVRIKKKTDGNSVGLGGPGGAGRSGSGLNIGGY